MKPFETGAAGVKRRPKVAMVIGSGSLKCVSAFGAIKALQRAEIPIDMVVACSGGAFSAIWLAKGGESIEDQLEHFKQGWAGAFDRMAYRKMLGAVFPRLFGFDPRFGLIRDEGLNRAVRDYVGDTCFEDLRIPLHLVATDMLTGEKVIMSEGSLFDAVRATVSIPMVFPPWPVQGRLLMDGAVCNPLPIDVAVREGADIIIALGFEEQLETNMDSSVAMFIQVTAVAVNHLFRAQYAFYSMAHHAEVIPILPDFGCKVGLRDLHLVSHLMQEGELAAEREIPYLQRLLQNAAQDTA